jgi:hypothetical protein
MSNETRGFDFGDGSPIEVSPRKPRRSRPRMTKLQLAESARLCGQANAILARLRMGSATNVELSELSLKYTGRVSDLRKRGHKIECVKDYQTGLSTYTLKKD